MPKVLIIGPKFHYFNQSIERAFRALGYDTQILAYDTPVHPYNAINKIRYKLAADKIALKRKARVAFQAEATAVFESMQPDLVFVMNGDMLLPETLLQWRGKSANGTLSHRARVALWFFDSFTHIPLCEENVPAVDAVFCYEQTDLPLIEKRYGVKAHFLPQAVDLELYHPLCRAEQSRYAYDLVFAGDIFHSQKRRELIQAVVRHYPQLKIRVWGEYKPWYKNPWKWLTRERKDVYMNRNATAEQLNHDYNRARAVLNVHIEQQKDGANPKVYEIAAAGAYQICDANPYVEQLFPAEEIGLYHIDKQLGEERQYEELFACIDKALTQDMTAQARQAQRLVAANHTFEQRIRQVLTCLDNEITNQIAD